MNRRRKCIIAIGFSIQVLIFYVIYMYVSSTMQPMITTERITTIKSSNDAPMVGKERIPKLLHQVFPSTSVFERYKPMIESCLRLNPDWKYYLWTEADANVLINTFYPKLSDSMKLMYWKLERSDATRYAVLHKFGGVYLDMDIECRKPLWPAIANLSAFTAQEPLLHAQIIHDVPFVATNAVMGCVPGHPFIAEVIAHLETLGSVPYGNVMKSTGPLMLTDRMVAYWGRSENRRQPLALMMSQVFMPVADEEYPWREMCTTSLSSTTPESERAKGCMQLKSQNWIFERKFGPQTIAIHHWMHLGWSGSKVRGPLFNIRRTFGQKIINSYAASFRINI